MSISCVIIGMNVENTIKKCLESIKNSDEKPVEILYVDDNSTDNSVREAKKVKGVRIIRCKTKSPGFARNKGWEAAKGDLVHFFDGDVIVDKKWLGKAKKAIK